MQGIVTYDIVVYSLLTKISCKIYISSFLYLLSAQSVYILWLFFEAKIVRQAKERKDPLLGYMQP